MGNIPLILLPPQNWQDFERLMKGIVDVIWPQEGWHIYGRPGQRQSGIDIFGYDEQRRFTGIQCKKVNVTDSAGKLIGDSLLTEKQIRNEIKAAEKIKSPKLERLIFATTASRDVKILDVVRDITDERKKSNKFFVNIWFWDDIQVKIESNTSLLNLYYADVLEKVHKYDKDIHILSMLRQAFTRPAFQREMHREESGVDFIQAIRNTQEAITTGHLYNRRGDLIATTYDYSKISRKEWKSKIWSVYGLLDKIRDEYQTGLKSGKIKEHSTVLEIFDDRLAQKFNNLRGECLEIMNQVLSESGLELIDSELARRSLKPGHDSGDKFQ